MNTMQDREAVIAAWLDDGPGSLPADTRQAITVGIRTVTRRRSGLEWPSLRLPTPGLRRVSMTLGATAVLVLAAAMAFNFYANQEGLGGPPLATDPPGSVIPSPELATSGGMWPQSTLDEVRDAQEKTDAGDREYAWQVDPRLSSEEWWGYVRDSGSELVERFLQEELGWDQFLFNPYQPGEYPADAAIRRVVYLRCAPGGTNPMYPAAPEGHQEAPGADRCAPTLDDFRYETVSLDLSQLAERGRTGIWVVSQWTITAPFAQTDPRVAEGNATAVLEDFLTARVAGRGAEGLVEVNGYSELDEVPLLYATTAGASYERYEIDVVSGPLWPFGEMHFTVRLFADGGATVVEQPIFLSERVGGLKLWFHDTETTENGQPLDVPYVFLDGELTLQAARPWGMSAFATTAMTLNDGESLELLSDPLPVGTGCETGAPPADAEALARALQSDPDFESTDPVSVTLGGIEGLSMDLTSVPGASVCLDIPGHKVLTPDFVEHRGGLTLERGTRIRLYLLDAPKGSSMGILSIAIVAPQARFESVVESATPILDSIEFHAP